MLNHARTLLMNVNGSVPMTEFPGEEIVDPGFAALTLPTYLTTVRSLLFGINPDRYMLNYRCNQLLKVAHATPLNEYLMAFDTRITYGNQDTSLVDVGVFSPKVIQLSKLADVNLYAYGVGAPPDGTGRMHHRARVTTTTTTTGEIARLTPPIQNLLFDFLPTTQLDLLGTGLTIRLNQAVSGQDWLVDVLVRPTRDISTIVESVTRVGEPVLLSLFGFDHSEPLQTFRELWFRKQELPLKLAALLCAIVYRSEEVRGG